MLVLKNIPAFFCPFLVTVLSPDIFFGPHLSALARWSLPKTKYLFSCFLLESFAQLTHQNYCACQACSKNALKMTIRVTEVLRTIGFAKKDTW
jgi:hypothetical protein